VAEQDAVVALDGDSVSADGGVVNTILSAVLAFSGKVLYPSYATAERISRLAPFADQVLAGSEMWVLNSMVFLIPVRSS
jgi:cytochrome c oxidase assembly factor CtaG